MLLLVGGQRAGQLHEQGAGEADDGGERALVLTDELFRGRGLGQGKNRAKGLVHHAEQGFWLQRLGEDVGYAAGQRQRTRLGLSIGARVEYDRGVSDGGVRTQLADKL